MFDNTLVKVRHSNAHDLLLHDKNCRYVFDFGAQILTDILDIYEISNNQLTISGDIANVMQDALSHRIHFDKAIHTHLSFFELQFTNNIVDFLKQIDTNMLIACFCGDQTLTNLRKHIINTEIALGIPHIPRIHPQIRSQDLYSLLLNAQYKDITICIDRLTVNYSQIQTLMLDLYTMGWGCAFQKQHHNFHMPKELYNTLMSANTPIQEYFDVISVCATKIVDVQDHVKK